MPELQVSALVNAPGWRYRPIRAHRLEQFAAAMRAGEPFSPLVAFRARDGDGNRLPGRYWIVDGRHRLAARRMVGRDTVDVDILDDGLRDAVMYACSASTIPELAGANDDGRRVAPVMPGGEVPRRALGRRIARRVIEELREVAPTPVVVADMLDEDDVQRVRRWWLISRPSVTSGIPRRPHARESGQSRSRIHATLAPATQGANRAGRAIRPCGTKPESPARRVAPMLHGIPVNGWESA